MLTDDTRSKGRAAKIAKAKANARAADIAPVIRELQSEGFRSLSDLAWALNERGIPTARGGSWQAVQVQRALERL